MCIDVGVGDRCIRLRASVISRCSAKSASGFPNEVLFLCADHSRQLSGTLLSRDESGNENTTSPGSHNNGRNRNSGSVCSAIVGTPTNLYSKPISTVSLSNAAEVLGEA